LVSNRDLRNQTILSNLSKETGKYLEVGLGSI